MKTIAALLKVPMWLWWNFFYAVTRKAERVATGDELVRFVERCRSPFWKFAPSVIRNEDAKRWEVLFSDEDSHVLPCSIDCHLLVGDESGKMTGIAIRDSYAAQAIGWDIFIRQGRNMVAEAIDQSTTNAS